MLVSFARFALFAGIVLLSLVSAGCSPGPLKITGKIMKGGAPMIVSKDTYVTLSFIPEEVDKNVQAKSYSAEFNHETGSYSVDLPPGKYRTMFVMAQPPKKEGELSAPSKPVKSDKVYDLSKAQELNIDIPGK
jgi:hypothetical protein